MNAAVARVETRVTDEDRIARIESDVAEIKDDVKTINIRLNESIVANAREFGSLRTDAEKRFGALQAAIEANKTETEKGFGALRAGIEKRGTDTEKGFGALQVVIESNKTETEKGFGGIRVEVEKTRTEIEKIRTEIESAKLWMLFICIGTLGSLLMSTLNFVSHTSRAL